MTNRQLAKLIVKSFDFTSKVEFQQLISFLTVCKFHTEDGNTEKELQNAIYYLQDKMRMVD